MAKSNRNRNATIEEVHNRLSAAGDYLGEMIKHEAAAAEAAACPQFDLESSKRACRSFDRDFQSFLTSMRTCWNYLIQLCKARGEITWFNERVADPIFRFHRELANQDLHDYQVVPGVEQRVRWEADAGTPMVQTPFGILPVSMRIVGSEDVQFTHNPKNMSIRAAVVYEEVRRQHGKKTIVQLAAQYYEVLDRLLRLERATAC